jgi:superfamily II DNA helicase RecQ
MNLVSACRQTARRTFRIHSLRPQQESAMLAVLNGRDALASLPTGSGKSPIYQVPAMIVHCLDGRATRPDRRDARLLRRRTSADLRGVTVGS